MSGLECIPLSMYCQHTGETVEAINKRIQRGVWLDGKHIFKIEGVKERWVDLAEITKWARASALP